MSADAGVDGGGATSPGKPAELHAGWLVPCLLTHRAMQGIKHVLAVLWLAGCGGGGGGSGAPGDAGTANDGHPAGDAGDAGTAGDASMVLATNDRCANAIPISLATMHSNLAATTNGAQPDLTAPCGATGLPDVFFKFTLTRRELVYADTFGASATTTLYFASSCSTARTGSTTPGDAVCSTGACGTEQSQVTALLDPGTHYLVLAGSGAATIHFQHAEVGTGSVEHLPKGTSAPTGTTSGFGGLYTCEAPGPENAYWWQTCPADPGGTFIGSTCGATDFDTVLSLQLPGTGQEPQCNDDACGGVQSTMTASIPPGAGLFVLDVDSNFSTVHGNYTLSITRP
jgi:hypothetical protein